MPPPNGGRPPVALPAPAWIRSFDPVFIPRDVLSAHGRFTAPANLFSPSHQPLSKPRPRTATSRLLQLNDRGPTWVPFSFPLEQEHKHVCHRSDHPEKERRNRPRTLAAMASLPKNSSSNPKSRTPSTRWKPSSAPKPNPAVPTKKPFFAQIVHSARNLRGIREIESENSLTPASFLMPISSAPSRRRYSTARDRADLPPSAQGTPARINEPDASLLPRYGPGKRSRINGTAH